MNLVNIRNKIRFNNMKLYFKRLKTKCLSHSKKVKNIKNKADTISDDISLSSSISSTQI